MEHTFIKQLKSEIRNCKYNTGFTISDFKHHYHKYETLKKTIARLEKQKFLIRVFRGIYFMPLYSKKNNLYSSFDPYDIGMCIARMNKWSIAPYGERALNMLGLSTQISNNYVFISSGPNRTYKIKNFKIIFKHRCRKDTYNFSETSKLVVQALKAIGRHNIDSKTIKILKNRLSCKDKKRLFNDKKNMMKWISNIVQQICEM